MKSYKTKGVILAAVCAGAMRVFALGSGSYVQNGLVNQWDGIDNAGTGAHVASATVWKDLAGSIDLTLKGSGAWNAAGTGLTVSKLSAQGNTASSAYRTIEVAYKMTSSGGRILFTSGCTSGANGTYYPRAMYFDSNGTKAYFDGSNRDTLYVPWTFNASAFHTMAGVYNSSHGISRIYGDGEKETSGVKLKNSWLIGDGKVSIGNRAAGDNYSWYGEVYTIRLYNRELTELELRHNNRIDLLRFNGGVGVDDAAITGGELQFKVAASAQGNGMVSVAGGAAAASASTWAADGATVVIEAVPASGSTFVGWRGDTSTAEISGATATVSATAPMNITAIFADGSLLTVSADTEIPSDITASGIVFTGGYTLSSANGAKVTIADDGLGIKVQSGTAKITCPVDIGPTSSTEQPITIPKNATLNQTGAWGGKADLRFVGAGTLQLRGDNTFDGNLYLTNGLVDVYSDNAFGSDVGKTYYNYDVSGWHMIFHGVTTPENFDFRSNDKSNIVQFPAGTTNVLLGKVQGHTNERWSLANNAKVVFSNNVDGIGCWVFALGGKGAVAEFWKNTTHNNILYFSGSGSVYWYAPGKFSGSNASSAGFRLDGNTHYLCCTNATSYKNEAGWANPQNVTTIDMCGNDQRARWLSSSFSGTVIRSADPATLHVLNGDAAYTNTYAGTFQGKVNVSVEGKRGLILTGDSTSLGFFAMTNNAHVQFTSGGWAGTNVFLGGGAELIVAGTPFIADAVLDVETASGRTKYVLPAGVVQQVKRLVVDGEEMSAGVYVAAEGATISGTPVGFISGQGAINVLGSGGVASDGVWDGGGSDAGYLTPENWEGDVVPEHVLGLVNVTFATGSATNLTVADEIAANGAVFTSDRDFHFASASESAVFGTAGGGLDFPSAGVARTNIFAVPYRINASQTWNVGTNRTVVFDEPVSSAGDGAVVVQGGGTVFCNAANAFTGAMRADSGQVHFATPASMGGSGAMITVNAAVLNGAKVFLPAGEINVKVGIDGDKSYPSMEFADGCRTVLNAALRAAGSTNEGMDLYLRDGSELVLAGGTSGCGFMRVRQHPSQTAQARIVVTNKPLGLIEYGWYPAGVHLYSPLTEFVLAATNACVGRLSGTSQRIYFDITGGQAKCAVTNAFDCQATTGPNLRLNPSPNLGRFDLDGFDQKVWCILGSYSASQPAEITSAKPAVLTVASAGAEQDGTCGARIQGLVTLRRTGAGTTTLSGPSGTAGRLVVEGGKVNFSGSGCMTNLSEVAVSGGELAINTASRIGKGADFRLSGGTVKISSGVEQHCKWLYVPKTGGTSPWRRKGCGRYTSATCEYISGDGAIVVDGDGSGSVIFFK